MVAVSYTSPPEENNLSFLGSCKYFSSEGKHIRYHVVKPPSRGVNSNFTCMHLELKKNCNKSIEFVQMFGKMLFKNRTQWKRIYYPKSIITDYKAIYIY